MEQNKAAAISAPFFKSYPNATELFITQDGQVFFNSNDAINHANSLQDKTVDRVEKNEGSGTAKTDKATIDKSEAIAKAKTALKNAEDKLAEAQTKPARTKAQAAVEKAVNNLKVLEQKLL